MSMSDFDTTIYKCIISTPADKTPHIPFKTVQETKGQSSSKYALVNSLELSSLTPYIKINNRQYFALEVVDINPEQKKHIR